MKVINEDKDAIIRKINALLAISKDCDADSHEALAAMAKARKLLAKYNLSLSEVSSDKTSSEVKQSNDSVSFTKQTSLWVLKLARVVSKYNKCATLITHVPRSRTYSISFVGEGDQAEIVNEMFKKMVDFVRFKYNNVATKYWIYGGTPEEHRRAYATADLYVAGFIKGLKDYYEEQNKEDESCALMVITPAEVNKYLEKFQTRSFSYEQGASAYASGRGEYRNGYYEGHSYNQGKLKEA